MVVANVPWSEESTWMSKLQSPSVSWDGELLRETMVPVTTAQLDLMVSRPGSCTPALGSVRQAGSEAAVVPAESPASAKAARARTASRGSAASQRRLRRIAPILPTPASCVRFVREGPRARATSDAGDAGPPRLTSLLA
jgi:hypothetical protein